MIAEHIRLAVMALIESDEGATDGDRNAVRLALCGGNGGRVVTFREAAKRTGLNRNTLRALCRNGTLRGVTGSGRRMLGIAESSLMAF
jgi:excisionase family DNA binding protein